MKEGWLKILKPVTLEIAIFRQKNQNFEWKTTLTTDLELLKGIAKDDIMWYAVLKCFLPQNDKIVLGRTPTLKK